MAQNTSDLIKLTNVNNVNNESIRNREHINRNIDGRTQVLQFQHVYACTCAASFIYGKKLGLCSEAIPLHPRVHLLYYIEERGYKKGTVQNHRKMKVENYPGYSRVT